MSLRRVEKASSSNRLQQVLEVGATLYIDAYTVKYNASVFKVNVNNNFSLFQANDVSNAHPVYTITFRMALDKISVDYTIDISEIAAMFSSVMGEVFFANPTQFFDAVLEPDRLDKMLEVASVKRDGFAFQANKSLLKRMKELASSDDFALDKMTEFSNMSLKFNDNPKKEAERLSTKNRREWYDVNLKMEKNAKRIPYAFWFALSGSPKALTAIGLAAMNRVYTVIEEESKSF